MNPLTIALHSQVKKDLPPTNNKKTRWVKPKIRQELKSIVLDSLPSPLVKDITRNSGFPNFTTDKTPCVVANSLGITATSDCMMLIVAPKECVGIGEETRAVLNVDQLYTTHNRSLELLNVKAGLNY